MHYCPTDDPPVYFAAQNVGMASSEVHGAGHAAHSSFLVPVVDVPERVAAAAEDLSVPKVGSCA